MLIAQEDLTQSTRRISADDTEKTNGRGAGEQNTTGKSQGGAESLDDVAKLIVAHFVDILGDVPNLSRALFEYATRAPDSAETGQLGRRRHQQYAFVFDRILAFADEITHADPQRAADLGLYFVTVTVRNRLLYPKLPSTQLLKISKRELKEELARMLTGYLRG